MWGELWIGTFFEDCPWDGALPISFYDQHEARGLLAQFLGDYFAMETLRALAAERSLDLSQVSDQSVIEHLAWDLDSGRLRIYRPARRSKPSLLSVAESRPAESPRASPVAEVERTSFAIELLSEEGFAVPEAAYVATFVTNGEERTGTLGAEGTATLADAPVGPVTVRYPDREDVLAKVMAVSARRALDGQDYGAVYRLLQQSPSVIRTAVARYDQYFNDYTGDGFVEDMEAVFTDPDALRVVRSLLTRAGVGVHEQAVHFDWKQQDGQ
jgi:hypothetical protein